MSWLLRSTIRRNPCAREKRRLDGWVNFHGRCLLYTECSWKNSTVFTAKFTSMAPCNFIIYSTVFAGILFAVAMGAYYIYALSRKDPNIGSQMWVLPFVLTSSLASVIFFIVACIISVGFKNFCDSFMKGQDKGAHIDSCADGQKTRWTDVKDGSSFNGGTYFAYLHASEGAAWVMFFVWAAQVGLGIVRIIRNRRLRSEGMFADSSPAGLGTKSEDLKNVAAAEPTA
ncbi:hypothetical protein BaRGS_00003920 [Batillaria attramentaria]|uniref:Uncharacterized protein n=1 Tax=Batillaria attramentaria TaxID=370345 RepID=A0ABD0LZT1_9CAEN